jgi:hypothetical protein
VHSRSRCTFRWPSRHLSTQARTCHRWDPPNHQHSRNRCMSRSVSLHSSRQAGTCRSTYLARMVDDDDEEVDGNVESSQAASPSNSQVKFKPINTEDGLLLSAQDVQHHFEAAEVAKKKSNAAKAARLQEADAQVERERDVIDLIGSTMDPDSAKVLWVATTRSRPPTKVAMQRCLRLHKVSFNKSVASNLFANILTVFKTPKSSMIKL